MRWFNASSGMPNRPRSARMATTRTGRAHPEHDERHRSRRSALDAASGNYRRARCLPRRHRRARRRRKDGADARPHGGARRGDRSRAASRWSSSEAERALNAAGVETVRCDLLDRAAVERLPDADNVVFMAGQKFGTRGAPAATWAMNTIVPAHCAERYARARIVAFSTGNVYPLARVASGG